MSREYEMHIAVYDPQPDRAEAIEAAIAEAWEIDDAHISKTSDGVIHTWYGRSALCGGETEEEFVKRMSAAIWVANVEFCHIEVQAVFLEDPPMTNHDAGKAEYAEWRKEQDDPTEAN